jgi:hypothetical protein
VMGGVELDDESELKVVTGVDDHRPVLRRRRHGHQGDVLGGVPGAFVTRSPATGSPMRSSRRAASASRGASAPIPSRCCSIGSCARTGSPIAHRRPITDPPARSSASTSLRREFLDGRTFASARPPRPSSIAGWPTTTRTDRIGPGDGHARRADRRLLGHPEPGPSGSC